MVPPETQSTLAARADFTECASNSAHVETTSIITPSEPVYEGGDFLLSLRIGADIFEPDVAKPAASE